MCDVSNFDDKEFDDIFNDIYKELTFNMTKEKQPKAFLLGGQPGAGKSTLLNLLGKKFEYNVVIISGDDYRKFHPHFTEIYHQYGDGYVNETQKFSSRMVERLIDKCSEQGYNLIVEGTLRNANTPLQTGRVLSARGYEVNLAAIATHPLLSYVGTLKRYAVMRKEGGVPRATAKEQHDFSARVLGKNIGIVYQSGKLDNILIFDRAGRCLYNQKQTPFVSPKRVIDRIHNRELSEKEIVQCINDLKYVEAELCTKGKNMNHQFIQKEQEVKKLMNEITNILSRER